MVEVLAAAMGLVIGSFLNVCIHRWPRDLSVVSPRSRCPGCEHGIAWYDNIPVLSYAMLRGRCRHCGVPISIRYPLVELLTALLFGYLVWRMGPSLSAARYAVLGAMLITLAFSDAETRILPDEFTLGGIVAGLVFAWFVPVPDTTAQAFAEMAGWHLTPREFSIGEALLGAMIPSAALWLGGWLFEKIRHKEGLGLGDVKMMAMVGSFLGVRATLLTLMAGSLFGSILGLIYIKVARRDAATYQLPFGTFLAAAALAVALAGQPVMDWYERNL